MTVAELCPHDLSDLSDRDLLALVERTAGDERRTTASLALLMELDARKLYAQQGCSSLFTYCMQVLHLSEHAAYLRIEAARSARKFPIVLERLAEGALHLTAIGLLAPHLTLANHIEVLDAACHKSRREVEELVARLRPRPDVPAVVRKLPAPRSALVENRLLVAEEASPGPPIAAPPSAATFAPRPPEIRPLAPERYKVQFTVSRVTYDKLRRVQNLLRHSIPDGDPSEVFDRALTLLLAEVSKTKFAATNRPQRVRESRADSRHVPAAVRREVCRRDGGRCAFVGESGRCTETGWLEFHHVVPYAKGGKTTIDNLELRCRTHNVYEAEQHFGPRAQSSGR